MRETDYLKENQNALSMLQRIERFHSFSEDNLKSFLEVGKLKEYDAGETIIKKGDKDQWLYFLLSGEVKIVKGEQIFAILKRSGDLFGEMGIIDNLARSASVWAQTKTTLLGIDCSNLSTQLSKHSTVFHYTIYRLFSECLANRLRSTNDEVVLLQKNLSKKEEELTRLNEVLQGKETLWI